MARFNKYKDKVWQKAIDSEYEDHLDTIQFHHKVCPWCGDIMIYSEFSPEKPEANIHYAWTIGFMLPLDHGGKKKLENLQAIHVKCEVEKASDHTLVFGLTD
jgi:hypothetical protein